MKKKIELYLEQDEIHKIIKKFFSIPENTPMESDTNAGRTTFVYEREEEMEAGR